MPESPNVLNYYIGKGNVYFKRTGDADFRHVGNVPEFEFTPEIEKLEHFSSMVGTKSKDRTIIQEKSATVRIVMEEWTAENLAIAFLGSVGADTAGDELIDIFSSSEINGALKFVGANDIGPRVEILLPSVTFIPGSSVNLISEEVAGLEINGDVNTVNGSFGTLTRRDTENTSA